VFGPSPRHYVVKVNRKARKAALRSVLSIHAERESLAVLDPAGFDAPSTKLAAGLLEGRLGGSVLVVVSPEQDVPAKSFRNLERVAVLPVEAVGVADIVGAAQLVLTQEAVDALTARAKAPVRATATATAEETV
jgi:large subunit ribosomal protein L4